MKADTLSVFCYSHPNMSLDIIPNPRNLGPSLRRWRVLNRVKQQALADELGVSQSKISRWESGASEPDGLDRSKVERLLLARPNSAADRALVELVSSNSAPVHLVCDLSHRLLAVSPARARDWHTGVQELMDRPLWPYASEGIQTAEHSLGAKGWFEPHAPDIVFSTERADFPEMTIPESRIRITRLALSDGRFARLVRDDPGQFA
ncbi:MULTISPECIES: helix-turn-helix domain-containing protein [unclassified Roseibium]|uniref:helix-turn-helix domain-containing protein n=1 Tax=unclassified Roseibium TaxID=2629323 RepID=UPI00273F6345|nr:MULTISPECIES: helix-turn-helix transcriptional regulator [unclassified Roseibium]